MIALPPVCQRRPWWLVIAAHEVGHHVQWGLPGAGERADKAITATVGDSLAARWLGWREELFADACAVLLTGPAVIWAITELETRPAPALGTRRYPPTLVRLAMARRSPGLRIPSMGRARSHGLPFQLRPEGRRGHRGIARRRPGGG
jgi:hypothetical protein